MSKFGYTAIEFTILKIVQAIENEININKNNKDIIDCLNEIGLIALSLFDYTTPEWADEYYKLFGYK